MNKNMVVFTSYEEYLSDEWKPHNGVCLGSVTSDVYFICYSSDVLTYVSSLPLGCTLDVNEVHIFCYTDDIALLAPMENALQSTHETPTPKLEYSSLKLKVKNLCKTVFKHKSKKFSTV